ncbi:MAG: helix-turn-helix domain containing protein [Desulfobulbaceae bacterium]|jgi:hypothetical protein|nr:helix-turn-helix domain containing protein [Desulfobulbaceae bacterium]
MKKVLMELSKYLGVKGLRGVAHYYGVPESRIYSWTKKGRIANPALILSRNPELSEDWVATGKGPMLADRAGRRRRRAPQTLEIEPAIVPEVVESPETVAEKEHAQKGDLPTLLSQFIEIIQEGGEGKAILEAQVQALTIAMAREREQKQLVSELARVRASVDAMTAMLKTFCPATPPTDEEQDETGASSTEDTNSDWE